uniref:Large ribosomal subunit protein uL23c n=2 Tax=Plagiogyria TaxID=32160 RepID=A0A6G7IW28_9MONI|nr:ribosomal protein L23 [Plagiogyria euphlebia]AJE61685.1 ribosomal protein L23 [Plagiogyria glauca]QII42575.1 ribosomal protein L23 [Plagiogyria euphlebia]
MDKSKNQVLTEKSIRLLQQNQYTFDVNPELTKSEMKDWIEQFFNVKVKGMNSHRLPGRRKGRRVNKLGFSGSLRRKRMIVTLRNNYSIPLFLN